ncbi:MAG: ATPase, T2SS/T4P/T4SS family [Patescibacteria group bacterium]
MSDTLFINKILNIALERRATDVHLVAGNNPVLRIDGRLITLTEEQVLTPDLISSLIGSFLDKELVDRLNVEREIVTIYAWANRARFRAKIFYQKGYLALSLRLVPPVIMSPKDLGIPPAVAQVLSKSNGLIIITGPYGSGRTTTAASLIETLNHNRGLHIQTLEQPIEYLFTNNQSIIEQREIGRDVTSFSHGLQTAADEDVDVILVSSLHEDGLEEIILELAESGKLVIVIMDADSVISALDRFISNLAPERRAWGQALLAEVLLIAMAQRLVPRVSGGLSLAVEVLTMTPAVKSSIKDSHLYQLNSIMQTSRDEGMIHMDKSLWDLVHAGEINSDEAMKLADNPQAFKQSIK